MSEQEKYHEVIKEIKNNFVINQRYEVAAYLRDIENMFFDSTFSGYRGFDKDKLIDELNSNPRWVSDVDMCTIKSSIIQLYRQDKLRDLLD